MTFGYRNFFNSKKEDPVMLSLKMSTITMSKTFLPSTSTDKLNKLKLKRVGEENILKVWKFDKDVFERYKFIRDKDKKDINQIFNEFIECKRGEMRSLEKYINTKIDKGFLNKSKLNNKIESISG